MSLSTLINTPCILILRSSGSTDELGNEQDDETAVASVCEIQQRRRDEPASEGEVSVSLWDGFFLPGAPADQLDTGDAVEVDALGTFELVGAPWPVRDSLTEQDDHIEATLKMTAGAGDGS